MDPPKVAEQMEKLDANFFYQIQKGEIKYLGKFTSIDPLATDRKL